MFTAFEKIAPQAKVWVYQANKTLHESTQQSLLGKVKDFINSWDSHGRPLTGSVKIVYDYFLILTVDENYNYASGCSIDKSVHFLKELGTEAGIDFFDRSRQGFLVDEKVDFVELKNIKSRILEGYITPTTPTFNNSVTTLEEFNNAWQIPAGSSWLSRYFKQVQQKSEY